MEVENQFFLQILGDHLRFFRNTLAKDEDQLLAKVESLIVPADDLLEQARQGGDINPRALVKEIKNLKKEILRRLLKDEIKIHLGPTFVNHMLNELEEYELILDNQFPKSTLDSHKLWIIDASGHAGILKNMLDPTEKEMKKKLKIIKKNFKSLYQTTDEYIGYLRSGLDHWPAIDKLDKMAVRELGVYFKVLEELGQLNMDKQVLSHILPLMIDHMLREQYYYLAKISDDDRALRRSIEPRIE